ATITSMSTYTTTQSSTCDLNVTHNGQDFRLYFLAYSNRPTLSVGMTVDIQGLFYRYYSATSNGMPNIEIRPYFTQDYIMESTGGNEIPTVTITSPTNGATISGTVTITGTASDSDGYITLVEVRIGSGAWLTATGTTSWSITVDTTSYSNGPTTITARATDNGSAQGTTSISVTISNTISYTTATIAQLYADTNANSNHFFTINNVFVIDNGSTSSPTSAWSLVVIDGSTSRSLVVYISKYAVRPSIIQLGDTLTISGKFMWYETSTKSYWEIEVNSTTNCSGDGVTLISSGGTLVYNTATPANILANIEMYNRTLVMFDDATIVDMGTYTTNVASACGLNVSLGGQTMYIYFNTYSVRPAGLTVGSVVDITGFFYVYYSGGVGLPEVTIRKWWTPDNFVISGGSNVPPSVSITSPTEGSTVSGEITISGTASDSDGSVSSVQVQFGNSGWLAVNGTTSWTITINTTGFANGPTTISARATDNLGAQTTSSISVTVSNVGVSYTMVNIGQLLSNPSNYANTFVHLQNVLVINNGSIKNTSTTWSLVVNDSTYQAGLNVYVKSGANRPPSILYLGDVINIKGKFLYYISGTGGGFYWEIEVNTTTDCPGDLVELVSSGTQLQYYITSLSTLLSNPDYYNRTLVKVDRLVVINNSGYKTSQSSTCSIIVGDGLGNEIKVFFNAYSVRPASVDNGTYWDFTGLFHVYFSAYNGTPEIELRPYWSPDNMVQNLTHHKSAVIYEHAKFEIKPFEMPKVINEPKAEIAVSRED
ncbi:MAG: Ig-like domain-containing protein, partial [Thermoplasmata archaeon]